jgi:hypothetical protein
VQNLCAVAWTGAGIDATSFATVKSARGYVVGAYVNTRVSCLDVVQQLLRDIACFCHITRDGLLQVQMYVATSDPVNTITSDYVEVSGISQSGAIAPIRRVLGYYQPRTHVLNSGEVSSAATQDQRLSATQSYLTLEPTDALSFHRDAEDFVFQTSIDAHADATAMASTLVSFLKLRREITIPIVGNTFQYWPGASYNFVYPRFGFDFGRSVFITGVHEQADGSCALIARYDPDPE